MADKSIRNLPAATELIGDELFVLNQGAQAKNVTWNIILDHLTEELQAHGGIKTVAYTSSSGADDLYTITYSDNTTSTFTITNGRGIDSLTWTTSGTAGDGQYHYGTFAYNDNTTSTITIRDGVKGDQGNSGYVHIRYAADEPTQDSDMKINPDAWIGIYSGFSSTAPTTYTSYTWYEFKGEQGETGKSMTGFVYEETVGLVDKYRVTFSDGTYTVISITNGSSIQGIAKTSTSGIIDTYTVTLTNGNTTTFTVTNGKGISSVTEVDVTHAAGHTDVYRFNFNDGDTYQFSIYNGTNGSGSVSSVDSIQSNNGDVPLLILGLGAPTTSTVGVVKQRYFDQTNNVLYICTAVDTSGAEATYTWQGSGVTVDSVLSTMSTNPVQNAVLTTLLGTTTMTTTAQTLTGAVNELDLAVGTAQSTADAKAAIADSSTAATTTWSSNKISGIFDDVLDDLAEEYDALSASGYAVGDYCIHSNVLYKCKTAIAAGGEAWTSGHWDEVTVVDEIDAVRGVANSKAAIADSSTSASTAWSSNKISSEIGIVASDFADVYSSSSAYAVGDLCIKDNVLYRCTTAIASGGETWTSGHWTATTVSDELSGVVTKAKPRIATISVGTTWSGNGPYTQTVTVTGGTANTKVDLQPDATVIGQMASDGCTALYVVNNNGTFTLYALDAGTTVALSIQATLMEVQ